MINILKSSDRHFSDMGWLKTYWLFSFSNYYDPKNISHGMLRVFNDDIVKAQTGFDTHPHEEMEIVSIILDGEMEHKDTMGNEMVIRKNDVQRMTAGTGLYHSEKNMSDHPVHFYQIWINPDKKSPIIVYGASPNSRDAEVAIEKLYRAGYENVIFLEGGIEEWRRAGYDLEGDAPNRQDDPQTRVELADGRYPVDTNASQVEWTGRNPNSRHFGSVDIANGVLYIQDSTITGTVEIDMNSIHNINLEGDELQPVLEAHLRSDDFFFTKIFPKAVFAVKEAKRIEPGWVTTPNYHVKGELNLRGVSADLEFDATASIIDDGSLVMEAHFDMDRTRWNVIYGSTRFFEHLGMHKVFDLISFQIRIVSTR